MQNYSEKQEEWIAEPEDNSELSSNISTPLLTQAKQTTIEQLPSEFQPITDKPAQILEQDVIETVCIDDTNITLVGYFGRKVEIIGRIKVTNIKVSFLLASKNNQEEILFQMPNGYMCRVQRYNEDKLCFSLEVSLKYGVSFKIRYSDQKAEVCLKTHQLLAYLIDNPTKTTAEYANKLPLQLKCQRIAVGNQVYRDTHWYDNQGWKKLSNYPQKFRVPLPYLSKNNPEQRLVVLSFMYHNGKQELGIWRTGPGRADSSEEEWMGKAKANPKLLTIQLKNKGIGSLRSYASRAIEIQSGLQLRDNFYALVKLAFDNFDSMKWVSQLVNTKWYEQIVTLLQEASLLVNHLLEGSAQITILAESQVRAAQLVALCQVLLLPECRTMRGFGDLIERQFLQWGSSRQQPKKEPDPQRGPAVIQFLDAVFQLTNIYPLSFEFSQAYLVFLAEQVYSNRFGNFLLLTKTIKEDSRSSIDHYACIWKTIQKSLQNPDLASYYLNPFYVDYKECDIYELKHSPSAKQIRIWNGFFFKKFKQQNLDYHIFHRYNQINAQHFRNKSKTENLRTQLSNLLKQLQQKKVLLNELKSFS